MTQKAVYVVSLGCPKNLVDAEVMCGTLAAKGYALTNDPEFASVMLINTCGFVKNARDEASEEIAAAIDWKQRQSGRFVVVSGCVPQRNPEETKALYPEVDLFMGVNDVPNAAVLFDELFDKCGGKKRIGMDGSEKPSYLYDHSAPRLQLTNPYYAYVKIAEGCDHGCRYCTIPKIRGRQRSRTPESILEECRIFLQNGVVELNLIAQDSTRYGTDLEGDICLASLLRKIDGLGSGFWVRILYTHPKFVSDDVIVAMAECKSVVPYIDIPLQHISDPVLKAMGRRFGEAETRELMDKLRKGVPGIAIRTTFMVGYPGETEEDFENLYGYVKQFEFDRAGVFVFSPEPGTPAAKLTEGLVEPEVAEERMEKLMLLQQKISLQRNKKLIGKSLDVLVEGISESGEYIGRSTADAPEIDNLIHFTGPQKLRTPIVKVKVREVDAYDLYGRSLR